MKQSKNEIININEFKEMFKAKLIEDNSYYKLKRKALILMLFPPILIGILVNFYQLPIWLTIIAIVIYIAFVLLEFKNHREINSVVNNYLIEVDKSQIQIKSNEGKVNKAFNIDSIDKLILKNEYGIPQESMKDLTQEISGNPKRNFIIIQQNEKQTKFEFELDSYYMLNQLKKIISAWKQQNVKIEVI